MSAPVHPPPGAPSLPPRAPAAAQTAPVSHGLSANPLAVDAAGGDLRAPAPPPVHPTLAVATGVPAHPAAAAQAAQVASPVGSDLSRAPSMAASIGGPPVQAVPIRQGPYPISAFVLKQGGAYVASIVALWSTSDGRVGKTEKLGGSIGFGHTAYRSLKDKGIPEGAFVRLGVAVALGKDAEARDTFIYEEAAPTSAYYHSGGTSLTTDKLDLITGDD